MNKLRTMMLLLAGLVGVSSAWAAQSGKEVFGKVCGVCHNTGVAGAPRYGNAGDWSPRVAKGTAALYKSALAGTPKGMPPKGGNMTLTDGEVKATVDYMLASIKDAAKPDAAKAAPAAAVEQKPLAPVAAPAAPVATAGSPVAPAVSTAEVNAFNRLLKPASKRNLPPPEDGIHDPANDGTHALQPPLAAFGTLPKSFAGNRVNWVEALSSNKINPRYDRLDPNAVPVVMDLNIVREVKGSMPDVVYPHKQHTEWLDCSNCHPAIFVPQKGANSISMAAILLGQKCGVCHGKVAFPVSECRICHSKKKPMPVAAQAAPN
ncbi:c(7)-type cytochrome triheme domain-containing protein [Denitratisoma oestradiolicum]|uniref:Cytochrome C n=1 Tax=Denitratisoma oestradiolicum TaxID=311182 RepID=A0A6S6YIZ8_9PROT|nr:c(7)-type cytochrome triheme domain-containing protein [Denitratisoma oestradiolicum]TWO80634.1 cytochrome C [Denitratisoma oestradiolicum]CAB1367714.1 Cytochrome C [Denitratisoma oestradiolicum]